MKKNKIVLSCGCVEEIELVFSENCLGTFSKIIKRCKQHEELRKKKIEEEKLFNSFPSKKAKRIYLLLDEMIEK